jgi:hypothetical protein
VFEGWNLFVILISLGGFAHVEVLTCAAWVSWVLWLIAVGTVAVSGASVFVWTGAALPVWLRRFLAALRSRLRAFWS